jgi:hypothetical protein
MSCAAGLALRPSFTSDFNFPMRSAKMEDTKTVANQLAATLAVRVKRIYRIVRNSLNRLTDAIRRLATLIHGPQDVRGLAVVPIARRASRSGRKV